MYIDANDNYEFNSRERFARFSVFNSSVAKGSAVGVVGTWGPWHTPLQWQPTPLPAFPQSLSSLSTRGSRGLSVRSFRSFVRTLVRPSLRLHARAYVIPLFLPQGLSTSTLLSVSPTLANRSSRNASPFSPLKIARIRNDLVFELTMEESLFLIRKTKSSL